MSKRERYFQWLVGDLSGTVEVLDKIRQEDGEYFYDFKSGESCNLRFISKITTDPMSIRDMFMVEVISPNDIWKFETIMPKKRQIMDPEAGETTVEVPPLEDITAAAGTGSSINVEHSKVGTTKFIAPKYNGPMFDLPSFDDYMKDDEEVQVKQETPVVKPAEEPVKPAVETPTETPKISSVAETDPVRILAKTCKKHPTEIKLSLTVNLPSKSIYQIADSEFDNGGKNFVDCLVENIDITEIVRSISNALHNAYASNEEVENTEKESPEKLED